MPSYTADRLFKMIKTPIGNSRSKGIGLGANTIIDSLGNNKTLNTMNTIDSINKDDLNAAVRQSYNAYNDLTDPKNNLRESKTFDQSTKEPLTMRDLEILE